MACCLQQHLDDNRIIAALAREAHDLKSKVEQLEESARRQQAALIAARDAIEQVECPQQHQVVDVLRKINAALRQK